MLRRSLPTLVLLTCALAFAPPAAASQCNLTLVDASNLEWDIEAGNGAVGDGQHDAYDTMGNSGVYQSGTNTFVAGYVNGDANACTYEEDGREIVFPELVNAQGSGLDLGRKVYVPDDGLPFARWLDIIENPGGTPRTVAFDWYGEYGELEGGVIADANGNGAVDVGERWAAFDMDYPPNTNVASLWDGLGADGWDRPFDGDSSIPGDDGDESVDYMYDGVVIPAGGRVVFMHIEHQAQAAEDAAAFALEHGDGAEEFLEGMSAAELAALDNWSPVPDQDGDGVRERDDNCPDDPNADQADLDGDGLGDVCDDDVDGDGLTNDVEERLGSDPRSADGDGDGVPDGFDRCPTRAGPEDGCPPAALTGVASPPASAPVVLPRLRPNRVTLRARRLRRRGRIRLSGRLLLPAGVAPADGCNGLVVVSLRSRRRTVASLATAIRRRNCTFRATTTARSARTAKALFTGNDRLTRRDSARVRVRRPRR